jgi:ATP-dependent DNA helicase RecQ
VERVAQMLVGSSGREVLARGLDKVTTYGKLAALPVDRVKDLLGVLADAGLLERHGIEGGRPGAFVLALTPEGRAVARGEVRPELDWPVRPPPRRMRSKSPERHAAEDLQQADADPELMERLRAWRTSEARERKVPPYVIFHDRTLAAIAAARPTDQTALARIKGVGPSKLASYGEALLELMK